MSITRGYSLVPIGGKGRGLVTTQQIKAGSILISEPPSMVVFLMGGQISNKADVDVSRQFCSKNQQERREVMELVNNYEDYDSEILGIFKTNAMVISDFESALFPKICRANHACVPNCNYVWNGAVGEQQLLATRDLGPGEEMTVSYLPDSFLGGLKERREYLVTHHNFVCMCCSCVRPPGMGLTQDEYQRKVATRKISQINQIAENIPRSLGESKVKIKYKSLCLDLLSGLEKMQVHPHILFLVKNCLFSISVLMLDTDMSRMWAKEIYKMSKVLTGARSPDTISWRQTLLTIGHILGDKGDLEDSVKNWTFII